MEKKANSRFKKILAIFTLIVLLQHYGLILGNVVTAIEHEIFDFTVSGNSDFMQIMEEKENQTLSENNENEEEIQEGEDNDQNLEDTTSEEQIEQQEQEPIEDTTSQEVQDTTSQEVGDTTEDITETEEELEQEEHLPEQVIMSSISSENSSIYKGHFYANIVSGKKYETNYNYTETIEVQDSNFIDEIYIEEEGDKFVFDTGVELNIGNNTYYKQTLISEEEFKNILGEEGSIELYSKDGEIIGKIDSQTEKQDGIYVFNYDIDINEIIVKIINPIQNGKLNIKHVKAIKSEIEYNRKQIELFRNIKTSIKTKAVYKEENIWELENNINLINLEETESRMDLDLNTNEFSTMLENQVTFHVTLKTNEERYDLFQDPTIEILMPSAIENVEITSINLLYKNDLSLADWKVEENEAGKKVIKVDLKGSQTEYTPGSMQEGTTLVIYTKINVNKLTSNTDEKIKMTYTNKNSSKLYYEANGKEAEEVDIKFVSKEGILKSNSIQNYNQALEGIYSFNNETLIGALDVGGQKQSANLNMAVVNNYSKDLTDVSIIGRIPTKGLKDEKGNDLGITVNTTLLNAIGYTGASAKIYYSPKIDAQIDDETWSENIADYGLIKSYKIVLDNSMKQGDRAEFNCNILIPEDLNYNEKLMSIYQVNYHIDGQLITETSCIGAETEKREIVLEDCNEQIEEEVKTEDNKTENVTIGMKVTKGGIEVEEGEEIFERQILRYTVVLKNTTSKSLTNVTLKGKANNSNLYYLAIGEADNYGEKVNYKYPIEDDGTKEFEEISIEELKPEESLKLEYQVIVKEVEEIEEQFVFGEVYLTADGIEETKIESSKNKIKQGKVELRVELGATETMDDTDLNSEHTIKYMIGIKNISNEKLENIDLNVLLPDIIEYDPESFIFGYDELERYVTKTELGNMATFVIPSLEINQSMAIYMLASVKEMDINKENQEVSMIANTRIGEETYVSNDYIKTAWQTKTEIEYEFTSNPENNSEIKNGDEIIYKLYIKNIGNLDSSLNIKNNISSGIDIYEVELIRNKETTKLENKNNAGFKRIELDKIEKNEEITAIIKAKIESDYYEDEQTYIENSLNIFGSSINIIETNTISFKILDNVENENIEEETELEDFYTEEEIKKFEEIKKLEEEAKKEAEKTNEKLEETEGNDNQEEKPVEEYEENEDEIPSEISREEQKENNDQINNSENEKNNINNNSQENPSHGTLQNQVQTNISTKGKYNIKGNIWVDLNKNGKKDSDETKLKDITVRLYKSSNGTSVVYSSNNLVNKVKTDSEGNYEFNSLENGYYLVMVEYDNENYSITEYKSQYAGESTNSEFISKATTIEGNKKTVAISDIIQINSNNISSIDLGLIQNDECDLQIKKSISSITIEDNEGKETIKYDEDKIAKLEISAKKLDKTKITIIYDFEIKNNGDLDTYVTNIVDYLPKELKFDEKSNSGWYIGENNNLYNLSLVNSKIGVGKTRKLKLALTMDVNDDKLGSYINKTEILETTNDKKVKEINLENNKAEVELLITIKTGGIIIFFSSISTLTIMGAIFIVLLKKKRINLKPVYK